MEGKGPRTEGETRVTCHPGKKIRESNPTRPMRSPRRNASSSSCRAPSCPSQESTCASHNVAAGHSRQGHLRVRRKQEGSKKEAVLTSGSPSSLFAIARRHQASRVSNSAMSCSSSSARPASTSCIAFALNKPFLFLPSESWRPSRGARARGGRGKGNTAETTRNFNHSKLWVAF